MQQPDEAHRDEHKDGRSYVKAGVNQVKKIKCVQSLKKSKQIEEESFCRINQVKIERSQVKAMSIKINISGKHKLGK